MGVQGRVCRCRCDTSTLQKRYSQKPLETAQALFCTGNMSFLESASLVNAAGAQPLCLMLLILGTGYFAGHCDAPLLVPDRTREAFTMPTPFICIYS